MGRTGFTTLAWYWGEEAMTDWRLFLGIAVLAFAPGLFWLWYFYKKDTLEPEPLHMVRNCFLLGIVAVIPPAVFESILRFHHLIDSIVAAPILEECAKFLVVRLFVYPHREFDEPMDGVVYACAAALGFASIENAFYLYHEYEKAAGSVASVTIIRAFLSVPGHAAFSIMWGYALGVAKFLDREKRTPLVLTGLVSAIGLHALFNSLAILGPLWPLAMLVLIPFMWQSVTKKITTAITMSPHMPDGLPETQDETAQEVMVTAGRMPWYENRILVVVLMFLPTFPIGMYGLWKNTKFPLPVKAAYLALWTVTVGTVGYVAIFGDARVKALVEACRSGDLQTAQQLVDAGVDLNARSPEGKTPLMVAAERGHLPVVQLLVTKGAEINARDNSGKTALALAREKGREGVTILLLKHGGTR
jgi:RsiW-degrading membrane proteinase PrsW (M82 family)